MTNIGEQIRQYRDKFGLTQIDLSKITGISRSRIQRIEYNEISPTILELSSISKVLEVEVCDLIDGKITELEHEFMSAFKKLISSYIRHDSSYRG